jgi:hypothetical protein
MDDRNNLPEFPRPRRRFVYRAAEAETPLAHPLRRATDQPRPFQTVAGIGPSNALLLKFRVYLKVN